MANTQGHKIFLFYSHYPQLSTTADITVNHAEPAEGLPWSISKWTKYWSCKTTYQLLPPRTTKNNKWVTKYHGKTYTFNTNFKCGAKSSRHSNSKKINHMPQNITWQANIPCGWTCEVLRLGLHYSELRMKNQNLN